MVPKEVEGSMMGAIPTKLGEVRQSPRRGAASIEVFFDDTEMNSIQQEGVFTSEVEEEDRVVVISKHHGFDAVHPRQDRPDRLRFLVEGEVS